MRGDGQATATTAEAGVSAVVAQGTHASYSGVLLVSKSVRGSDAGFHLFKVCRASFCVVLGVFVCLLLMLFGCARLCLRQASTGSGGTEVEQFSVRGDGSTAATMSVGSSAPVLVAHASASASYTGTVLTAKTARVWDAGFYLLKVVRVCAVRALASAEGLSWCIAVRAWRSGGGRRAVCRRRRALRPSWRCSACVTTG